MYIKLNSLQPLFEGFFIAFFRIFFGYPGNSKFLAINVLIVNLFQFDPAEQHILSDRVNFGEYNEYQIIVIITFLS
jgi:hypothetical protein